MSKFTIEFGPKSAERLRELAASQELTKTEVVRRALGVYDAFLEAQKRGERIILESEGSQREIISL